MQSIYKKYILAAGVIWGLSIAGLILVYCMVLGPQNSKLEELKQQLSEKEFQFNYAMQSDSNEVKTKLVSKLEKVDSEVMDYAARIEEAGKLAFDIGQIADVLKLKDFSCKNGQSEIITNVSSTNHLASMVMNVNFKGNFNQLARFINTLERHRPFFFVESFNIARSNQDPRENEIGLVVKAYVCRNKMQLPCENPKLATNKKILAASVGIK